MSRATVVGPRRMTITQTEKGGAQVKLHIPQRAITPGQACVLYQNELVLVGGWITR